MKLFKSNKTKWMPLGNYRFCDADYIVFFRKNLKTGMMYFKVRKVHHWYTFNHNILPPNLIDVKEQWNKLFNL